MKNRKKYEFARTATLVMLVFSMLFLVTGVTFAVYKQFSLGTTENFIEAGTLSFSYNEDLSSDNRVSIENALPIPDSRGKILKGQNEYFDFSVSSTATIADIYYEVVVMKEPDSTLDDSFVKIYLTTRNGTVETASPLVMKDNSVKTFQELGAAENSDGKVVYIGTVKEGTEQYQQNFRLRMWLSSEIEENSLPFNQSFSVRVRVNAIEK